jgi:hypothetical protein
MDAFIRWITAWIEEEFAALQTALSDRTGSQWQAAVSALAKHYAHPSLIEIDRSDAPDGAQSARADELARIVVPRRLFKAAAYASDNGRTIWRAYLGGHNRADENATYYARSYFVRGGTNSFQIFSIYAPDSDARELGDELEGWYWVHGSRVDRLGEPTEVRRLVPPGKARDRREFDRGHAVTQGWKR